MSYLEVYKKRISHLGTSPQERAFNSGILEFRRYLKYNQHTQYGLKSISNIQDLTKAEVFETFDGVILTDKEDDNRVSQILLTKVLEDGGPALKQGDLIEWNNEVWLIYRSTTSSYQPHQKFYMVRCNHYIKWIDTTGILKESWVYLLGSKDSKIKDNFRTWNDMITPQPNKYIHIIMPHQLMAINTEIMVLDEVWYLVDYDQNSVPGVIHMSFTETNLNQQRDDVNQSIANIDKLAVWSIDMPKNQIVQPNTIIDLNYSISKDGVLQDVKGQINVDGNLTLLENGLIQAHEAGGGTVTVSYNGVSATQTIVIGAEATIQPIFIGNERIRLTTTNEYILENADQVEFDIGATDLVTMVSEGNHCSITANSKNKIGTFTLTAKYKDKVYTKKIKVVALWQVV